MLVLVALGGCKEEPGDLDPQVVHDLARQPGTALGLELTGDFDGELVVEDCQCPELTSLEGLSLCQGAGPLAPDPGDSLFLAFEVVQTDGILLFRYSDLSLTGPIDEDGAFAVGGVFDMTTLFTTGKTVTRVDGEFDGPDEFTALIRNRLAGEVMPGLGELTEQQSIDCVETFTLDALRR